MRNIFVSFFSFKSQHLCKIVKINCQSFGVEWWCNESSKTTKPPLLNIDIYLGPIQTMAITTTLFKPPLLILQENACCC